MNKKLTHVKTGRSETSDIELTKKYYEEVHAPQATFVPGETRVNYGGRYFDAEEMVNLVDASLDFWLTAGPWAHKVRDPLCRMAGSQILLPGQFRLFRQSGSIQRAHGQGIGRPPHQTRRRGDNRVGRIPTTVAPILQYGAVPVFVDMSISGIQYDTTKLESAFSPKTKAVMLAHSLGNPFDLQSVVDFCRKHNLWLVEDNCDALGSEYLIDGQWKRQAQSATWAPAVSIPHHMTMGEGGAVYTNNPELHKYVNSYRDWGRECWCMGGVDNTCGHRFTKQFGQLPLGYDHKYVYSHMGYNLKATDLQAAIGCAQLNKLDDIVSRRRHNFDVLHKGLEGTKD